MRSVLGKMVKIGLIAAGLSITGLAVFLGLVYSGYFGDIPDKETLSDISGLQSTQVYDESGKLMGEYFIENRTSVKFEEISPYIPQYLIAVEDHRFYDHEGIDYTSLFRVFVKSIILGDNSGGGSTISQQLAKNLFPRQNYGMLHYPVNKTREMIIARRLEEIYSKEEILTLYLNTVSFGLDIFGIEKASQTFYGKSAFMLDKGESAMLIGMLKATTYYNPMLNPENAIERRNFVLSFLHEKGLLEQAELENLSSSALNLDSSSKKHEKKKAPYFLNHIKWEAENLLNTILEGNVDIERGGYKIYTTMDLALQNAAEKSLSAHLATLQKQFERQMPRNFWDKNKDLIEKELSKIHPDRIKNVDTLRMTLFSHEGRKELRLTLTDSIKYSLSLLQSGLLAAQPSTGAIKAWVGGIDFTYFQYDHITSKRQVGSTIKPFVYGAALQKGISPCKYYETEQTAYQVDNKIWSPRNSSDVEENKLTMEAALEQSVNTVSVKILRDVGIDYTMEILKKSGITSDIPAVPSLVLGTPSLSLYEMVQAYTTFANEGWTVPLYSIEKIVDKDGNEIYKRPEPQRSEVFDKKTSQTMRYFLENVVNEGTGQRLRSVYGLKNPMAGKTGTTQNGSDGWFIGFSPDLVVGVWTGGTYPAISFSGSSYAQGAHMALPIYGKLYQEINRTRALRKYIHTPFPELSSGVARSVDCNPILREFRLFEWLFRNRKEVLDEPEEVVWEDSVQEEGTKIGAILRKIFRKGQNPGD